MISTSMACNLVILFAKDSERLVKELIRSLKNITANAICVNELAVWHVSPLHQQTNSKSRLHILFFSPDFLQFLECKALDAFNICGWTEPEKTLAIFCCGLSEESVRCHHIAPLNSYYSWRKYQLNKESSDDAGKVVFPKALINRIQETVPKIYSSELFDIITVPRILNKDNDVVYIIFQPMVKKLEDISVCLEGKMKINILPEVLNPYVLRFGIPAIIFRSEDTIKVVVKQRDRVMTEQILRILPETSGSPLDSALSFSQFDKNPVSPEDYLDEQLKYLSEVSCMLSECDNEDYRVLDVAATPTQWKPEVETDRDGWPTHNMVELCKGYEHRAEYYQYCNNKSDETMRKLEADDHDAQIGNLKDETVGKQMLYRNAAMLLKETASSMEPFLNEAKDDSIVYHMRRSQSLPSTLNALTDFRTSHGHYMDMSGILKSGDDFSRLKPHQLFIKENIDNRLPSYTGAEFLNDSLASGIYVSMIFPEENEDEKLECLKTGMSQSQKELLEYLYAFKHGFRTISDVEEQFKSWYERYRSHGEKRESELQSVRLAYEEAQKIAVASSSKWKNFIPRKPKRKESKSHPLEGNKESTKKESQTPIKKISDASASSTSSKNSCTSSSCTEGDNKTLEFPTEPVKTGWVFVYPTTTNKGYAPCYTNSNPPPLPPRNYFNQSLKNRPTTPESERNEDLQQLTSRKCVLGEEVLKKEILCCKKGLAQRPLPPMPPKHSNNNGHRDNEKKAFYTDDHDSEEERTQSLMDLCQKYGLGHLTEHFFSDTLRVLDEVQKRNSEYIFEAQDIPLESEQDFDGYECPIKLHLKTKEDSMDTRTLRRSRSLPSSLYETVNFYESPFERHLDKFQLSSSDNAHINMAKESCKTSFCEHNHDILNSMMSNPYMSLDIESSMCLDRQPSLPKHCLNDSQQELLELMFCFKRGEKTISQVEQQFREWHARHQMAASNWDFALQELRNQWMKSRKCSTFALPDLKNLITWKPRKNSKKEKLSAADSEKLKEKRISEASDANIKRLSYISISSGCSDNNEVFKTACCNERNYGKEYEPVPFSDVPDTRCLEKKMGKLKVPLSNMKNDTSQPTMSIDEKFDQVSKAENSKPLPPPKPTPSPRKTLPVTSHTRQYPEQNDVAKKIPEQICPIPPPKPKNLPKPNNSLPDSPELAISSSGLCRTQTFENTNVGKKTPPLPPPKPKYFNKLRVNENEAAGTERTAAATQEITANGQDENFNSAIKGADQRPPSSPTYIVPDTHHFFRNKRKKQAILQNMTKPETSCMSPEQTPSPKSSSSSDGPIKAIQLPSSQGRKKGNVVMKSGARLNRKVSVLELMTLPTPTLNLLSKANLVLKKTKKQDESTFYIRRWSSYPELRISQLQPQPIYIELLP
ncbi:uncharacterized protein LOC118201569 [Stegodyphus dumicola]|uniref:uncharacterized protein LOC118201569 n=1 Tax=Stegodyphus dumicola TaxID=202533 RepID=UPI0015AA0B1B|nr:uncharacterized protein LOC118201569 [Stegodyphus dumicola]